MSEWEEVKLSDIADVRDGTHDSPKESKEGKFLITSKHIKNGKIDFSKAYQISINDFDTVNKRSKVDKYDILFSMIGTIGEMVIVDFEPDFAIKNIGLFKTNDKDVSQWIYYYFKSNDAQAEIDASLKGSTQQYITLGDLRNFPIKLPPIKEQKAIAEVLSSLDDKIDLLHRQNKTLEELAQTLFRQWFIEEAKDEWEIGTLDEILTVKGGTTPSTKNDEYWNGDICWSTPKDLSANSDMYLFDTARKITESGLAKIGSGLLPKGTILLSSRAPVGYLAIAEVPLAINQGYIAILDNKSFSKYFIFLWLKSNMEYIISNANGSTFLEISKTVFKSLEIIKPPKTLREKFDEIVEDNFEKIKTNTNQIKTLENIRDTLLPKLMSGEIRIKD